MTTGLLGRALASRAEHHGKALAYLELGETDKAIREAKTALNAAPDSPRLQQTVIGAYEEKGLYASAARLNRTFLSDVMTVAGGGLHDA
jgi:hypothetical protein